MTPIQHMVAQALGQIRVPRTDHNCRPATIKQVTRMRDLRSQGKTVRYIAVTLGFSETTVRKWLKG